MKEYMTLINDVNPNRNWQVLASLNSSIWIESIGEDINKQNNSTIVEINLVNGDKKELALFIESFQVIDLVPTEYYLYLTVISDERNQLIQVNRKTNEVKKLWVFDFKCQAVYIHQVLQDSIILFKIMFESNEGDIWERYDLLKIIENKIETVYIDNEDMIDSRLYLTDTQKGPLLILDKHITPSDKHMSNGLPDLIAVYEL